MGRTLIRAPIETIATHRTDSYDEDLPEEAKRSIEEFKEPQEVRRGQRPAELSRGARTPAGGQQPGGGRHNFNPAPVRSGRQGRGSRRALLVCGAHHRYLPRKLPLIDHRRTPHGAPCPQATAALRPRGGTRASLHHRGRPRLEVLPDLPGAGAARPHGKAGAGVGGKRADSAGYPAGGFGTSLQRPGRRGGVPGHACVREGGVRAAGVVGGRGAEGEGAGVRQVPSQLWSA